jgi:hypothetical protein
VPRYQSRAVLDVVLRQPHGCLSAARRAYTGRILKGVPITLLGRADEVIE